MERVKNISKIKVSSGYVLLQVHIKESLILTPDNKNVAGPQVDYAEVMVIGSNVEDLQVGDIVLDFKSTEGFKWGTGQFALVPRMNIKFAVERDNFTFKIKSNGIELKN